MTRVLVAIVVAVPCAILLAPVALAIGAMQLFAATVRVVASAVSPRTVPWPELMMFDRRLGWRPRPNVDACYLADMDDVYRLVTDDEGWPGRGTIEQSDIVVIGDSFAFGYGADTGRSYAALDRRLRVKAIGAPGYSMVHGALLMEQLGERLRGKLVVWFAYLENDLQDNLAPEMRGYRAPFVRPRRDSDGWEVVDSHVTASPWRCSDQDRRRLFARFCVPGVMADRAYSACDHLVERASASCARAGAQLVIVSIPHPAQLTPGGQAALAERSGDPARFDAGYPDRRLADICERHHVPMRAARQCLTRADYKRREGIHWNQRGHRRMAALLGELLEAHRSGGLRVDAPSSPSLAGAAMSSVVAGAVLLLAAGAASAQTTIPQDGWTLVAADSEETAGEDGAAVNAFDGNVSTAWVTQWTATSPVPPHQIDIDLGATTVVTGFRYLPRQDGNDAGRIGQYEFYVSLDGASWGTAVASGTFPNSGAAQQVLFAQRSARYVRFREVTEVAGRPWAAVAELDVLAPGPTAPPAIPNANWTLLAVDSQETVGQNGAAINAFDGSPGTMWVTQWLNASPAPPHDLQIDLGATYSLGGFRYLPRQDGNTAGRIGQYEFSVSTDGVTWNAPVASGVFPNSASEQQVLFTATTGRYVRLRALTEVLGRSWTAVAELGVLGTPADSTVPPPIPHASWTLLSVDSEESTGENGAATRAFDDHPDTYWVTQWSGTSPPPPHDLRIDLGATYAIGGFRYLPRQDGNTAGRIGQYEFYTSIDGVTWGAPATTGSFANSLAEQEVAFTVRSGRYVWLRALTEVLGRPWTAVAELNVLGTGDNQPPDGTIDRPATNLTIAPGQSVTFGATGVDPDANLPLAFHWTFGAGGPPAIDVEDPGAVVFPTAGVYTVTLQVTDALGQVDPTPATRVVTVDASGTQVIPRTNWTVKFVDSAETDEENAVGTKAFDGNPATHWASKWQGGALPLPHEIQIDLGALADVIGFRYLPIQRWQSGRIGDYEFYVSSDGANWGTPVAVGSFPDENSGAEREVLFAPKSGRYVRLRALTEVNGADQVFSAVAELNVLRASAAVNAAPVASIVSPAAAATVPVGSALGLIGSASDPDDSVPLTYRWSLTPGSGVADRTELEPGVVHFEKPGTFVLTFTVGDDFGKTTSVTRTITVLPGVPIPHSTWTLFSVDSEETVGENGAAVNAFDSTSGTYWITQWSSASPRPPHEIVIDLGGLHDIGGFRYLPRQDGNSAGRIGQYEFSVSSDGLTWGEPVAVGTFPNSALQQQVVFPAKRGQYVRLRALREISGREWTAVADLQVLERTCPAPSVRLTHPRSGYLQSASVLNVSAEACLGSASQGVRFVVDGGPASGSAQVDVAAAPFQATLSNLAPGEHVVEAFLVENGAPVSGAATYDVASPVGVGEFYVAIGDGITLGYADNAPQDDNTADGRTRWGGYTSILADTLTVARGHPVTVANEGVGATSSRQGLASLPMLLLKYPHAQFFIVNYGHNDFLIDGAPSGLGTQPGDAGYAGSFKESLQQIIDTVKAAGRSTILTRAMPVLPVGGTTDRRIQEYNLVIDELASDPANAIPFPPPDLYPYFAAHPEEYYTSGFEPNGVGYQSFARIIREGICAAFGCPNEP